MALDNTDPATKGDLTNLRIELKSDMADLRTELKSDMNELEFRVMDRMETIETRLLTAFQQWAVPVNARLRKLEAGDGMLDERLAMIEERLMTVERRLGAPPQRP